MKPLIVFLSCLTMMGCSGQESKFNWQRDEPHKHNFSVEKTVLAGPIKLFALYCNHADGYFVIYGTTEPVLHDDRY